ncbi:hypothetical protein Baya_9637 [Bagarius yarrelli]|uniref:Uncharacterized protein n=1 Tax=Bagarius yarrelli TaxID=175774 RepID=A0A556UXR8_BAGYA|nr:hypothetical protein Baya_9637 [Bagarius yarrelli]
MFEQAWFKAICKTSLAWGSVTLPPQDSVASLATFLLSVDRRLWCSFEQQRDVDLEEKKRKPKEEKLLAAGRGSRPGEELNEEEEEEKEEECGVRVK